MCPIELDPVQLVMAGYPFSSCPPFYYVEQRAKLTPVVIARDEQLVRVLLVFEDAQLGERVCKSFCLNLVGGFGWASLRSLSGSAVMLGTPV